MVTRKQEANAIHDTVTFSYLKSFHENEKKKHQIKQKNLADLCVWAKINIAKLVRHTEQIKR